MTRTLIVYYSMTGSTKRVAELLQELTQWPSAEVTDVGSHGNSTASSRHLMDSSLPKALHYELHGPNPTQFERLVVVAPAWLGQLAPPMRGLLCDIFRNPQQQRAPKVSLVCVVGTDGALTAMQEMAAVIGGPPFPILLVRHDDVLDGSCVGELQTLSDRIRSLDETQPDILPI